MDRVLKNERKRNPTHKKPQNKRYVIAEKAPLKLLNFINRHLIHRVRPKYYGGINHKPSTSIITQA